MRVALISDLHGNELALEAVLAELERTGVDRLICLGDVATLGPRPREVLGRLRDLGCLCILGNHDEFLLDPELVRRYSEVAPVVEAVDWCRAQLGAADLDFVRGFQATAELALEGGATLSLFHGTPRSHMEDLLATTAPELVDEMLSGRRATVLAGGHTHLQMLRQHQGMLLVNPGSLGCPFRAYVAGQMPTIMPYAEYAVVESRRGDVRVELGRVALDARALAAHVAVPGFPLAGFLAREYSR